jgi:hypothetical protein
MTEVLVWLLLVTRAGGYNGGNVSVVERFSSEVQCTHVLNNIPNSSNVRAKCVQANTLVVKGN